MNYKEIINSLDNQRIIKLMEQLGAERYIDTPRAIIFPTICHNPIGESGSMKLYYYKDNKVFVCYTECGTMSIFKLLEHYYEVNQIEYDWFEDIYDLVIGCSSFSQVEGFQKAEYKSQKDQFTPRAAVKLPVFGEGVLDCFQRTHPVEWLKDGISAEAMDKFGIRYSISQRKIIIPHRDAEGNLVGIRGRALNEWEVENLGKYMPVRVEQTWYTHKLSMNLYGLYENKENIRRQGVCYLFEAEKSVLQVESFDGANCAVAVCGSNFNKYQLNLLLKYCAPSEIIICFDREQENNDKYFNKLYNIGKKYSNYCNFSFVYDREGLLCQKDSPSDRGQATFEKLITRRVRIK